MAESNDEDDGLACHGCSTLARGLDGRVGITSKVKKEWEKLDAARKGRLKRTMAEWCAGRRLHREVYKSGGKYGQSPGGRTIAVFKTWQVRLYGFEAHLDDTRTFIIVDCDMAKKRDDADADTIARLKVRADAFGKGKMK